MNKGHAELCSSQEWAEHIAQTVLPAALGELTPEMQDRLFAEARRVLRPGGVFAGSDGIDNVDWRDFHGGDTCVPVDPDDLPRRLTTAGFAEADVRIVEPDGWFTFSARA